VGAQPDGRSPAEPGAGLRPCAAFEAPARGAAVPPRSAFWRLSRSVPSPHRDRLAGVGSPRRSRKWGMRFNDFHVLRVVPAAGVAVDRSVVMPFPLGAARLE